MLSGCKGNHSFANNAQYCEKKFAFLLCIPSVLIPYPFRSSLSVSFPSVLIIRFVRPYLFPFLPSLFHIPFVRYRPLSRSLKADFIRSHRSSPLSPHRRPLTTGDRCLTGASPTRLPLPFCRTKTTARYLLLVATRRLARKKSFAKIAATLPPTFRNRCVSGTCRWWQ